MRTTLDIADDVLFAAKAMARREKKPLGWVISELSRRALHAPPTESSSASPARQIEEPLARYGVHALPARGGVVTNELIDRLRDDDGG